MTEKRKNDIFADLLELNAEIHEDEFIATNDNDFDTIGRCIELRKSISGLLDYLTQC